MPAHSAIHPLHLQSEVMVVQHLRRFHPDAPSGELFQSASKVAACTRQAAQFQEHAARSDVSVQPLLTYYAILHWMKTVLYLTDLHYPPSSSVLQHGLSLRRSKKTAYRWPLESVHVYREGVLQSFWAQMKPSLSMPGRFVIGDVLGSLPGLCETTGHLHSSFQHTYPVQANGSIGAVARRIASNLDLTVEEWTERYLAADPGLRKTFHPDRDPDGLLIIPFHPDHPWLSKRGTEWYLHDGGAEMPEWVCHFVLYYALSTLCRYNPVEWSDILTWNDEGDALLVREYLQKYPADTVCATILEAMDEGAVPLEG